MANAFGKTAINENGGAQSELDTRFDLIPPCQLRKVAEVLAYGAEKYGVDNWKLISYEEHLNHVLQHINAEQLGLETGEPHLQHALVRMFFAAYMRDKNPKDFIGKVEYKNHCKEIEIPGYDYMGNEVAEENSDNYSVSATSPSDPETTKNILRIFGMEADTEPPMTMGDFFGEDNDKEYPIIRTETVKPVPQVPLMLKGLGDK